MESAYSETQILTQIEDLFSGARKLELSDGKNPWVGINSRYNFPTLQFASIFPKYDRLSDR